MSKLKCCSNSYLVIVYLTVLELQQLGESSFLFQQIASPVHKILNA